MFDPFGGTSREHVEFVNLEHCINFAALLQILIEKGITTEQGFIDARLRVQPMVEQIMQGKIEEARKQFEEDNPGAAIFFKLMGGQE